MGGGSRPVVGAVRSVSDKSLTRKTIRRNILERLAANERGDIHLDNVVYNFILDTLGTDDEVTESLPILPEKTIPNLPIPPDSLTRGCPNSNFPQSFPQKSQSAQLNKGFHFGGYDGGFAVGLEGEYREGRLEELRSVFDVAKERAGETKDGKFAVMWRGYVMTIYASGVTEGLQFKYRLDIGGMRVLIRDKTTKGYQSIRVRFSTESLITNSALANWRRLLGFLNAIGFAITKDCISRVDFQLTCDFFTVADVVWLLNHAHVVRKVRKKTVVSTGDGSDERYETVRLGTGSNPVQFEFYDKWVELQSAKNFPTQKYMLTQQKIGDEWRNSGRPVTRFEISVKRDGLKAMDINSVDDLFGNEWAIINLLTQDWIRIVKEPKIKGKEYKQQNHPLWDKIRNALYQHFNGKNFDDVAEWNSPAVSGDPEALEKQAMGCLSKSVAVRYGQQETRRDLMAVVLHVFDRHKETLYDKINTIAIHTENKTGVKLGGIPLDSMDYESDMRVEAAHVENIGKRKIAEMFQGSDCPDYHLRR